MDELGTENLSKSLQHQLSRYFAEEWRGGSAGIMRCDVVLALLRVGTPEARKAAERIIGKPILTCPPHVPPWPPRPTAKERGPRVTRTVAPNELTGDMLRRFRQVRVGMTVDQLLTRGISKRDIRVWKQRGILEVSP